MATERKRNGTARASTTTRRMQEPPSLFRVPHARRFAGAAGTWSPPCTGALRRRTTRRTNRPGFRSSGEPSGKVRGDLMKVRVVFLGILMLASTLPIGAGERLTLKVSPAVAFAPANLVVRATILADADNRAVEIVAE